jgi:sulfide:quinone oxidoreductase
MTRVVIAGGGVAALEAALALREQAAGLTVELLCPETHFWYRPLSVAAPFELSEERRYELGTLALEAGATHVLGTLAAVAAGRHELETADGGTIPYDALLVACGAMPRPAFRGAITFRGQADVERIHSLLDELSSGSVERVVFAVPRGAVWSLPSYELALMTAARVAAEGLAGVELTLVTPEHEPLAIFGPEAGEAITELFHERDVALCLGAHPVGFEEGRLLLDDGSALIADRVVATPRLRGPRIDGLPQTIDGFVPTDVYGRVLGLEDVYAAGDVTNFPVKQGGLAA